MTTPDATQGRSTAAGSACQGCRDAKPLPFAFTMAFQPIVDIVSGRVFAYEALVRGTAGEGAGEILAQVEPAMIYKFDQECRVRAIELAGRLFAPDDDTKLSINIMPNAVYDPETCLRTSMAAARRVGFDPNRLMVELTEQEPVRDVQQIRRIINVYRSRGIISAIDDFGAGFAGLSLLADVLPDVLKVDMNLTRGIDGCRARQEILRAVVAMTTALGISCVAEGIETEDELATVRAMGIRLCQGYHLARPGLESLPVWAG